MGLPKTLNYQQGKCVKSSCLEENENNVPSFLLQYLKKCILAIKLLFYTNVDN